MKTIHKYFLVLSALILFSACEEEGRIDQIDKDAPAPQKATITAVESKPGGAVIRFSIPDDDNILSIKVIYDRNGEECSNMASRYVDTLVIEGLGDTQLHKATVYTMAVNGKLSDPTDVEFTPETPTIQTTQLSLSETFGGIRIGLEGNTNCDDLAVVLLSADQAEEGKEASEIDWTELYTFHTSVSEGDLIRRDLSSDKVLYGAYIRDRWGNTSPITFAKLAPLEERLLNKKTWTLIKLPGDWWYPGENRPDLYDVTFLWDGDTTTSYGTAWYSLVGPRHQWFTIDLGVTAKLSRFRWYPYYKKSTIGKEYSTGLQFPYHFKIWGSMKPNEDGSFDDSWYLLGDFITKKPSGYTGANGAPGTVTDEDKNWWWNTNDSEFVKTDQVPDPQREVRYVRIEFLDAFDTYLKEYDEEPTNICYFAHEFSIYGQVTE